MPKPTLAHQQREFDMTMAFTKMHTRERSNAHKATRRKNHFFYIFYSKQMAYDIRYDYILE